MASLLKSLVFGANICCRSTQLFLRPALPVRCLALASAPKAKGHARSPFILFYCDKYSELSRANPGVRLTDVGRMVGQMWRVLPDEQKQVYQDRFKAEKAECDVKRQAQLAAMTETERDEMQQAVKEKRQRLKVLRRRRMERELDKPKADAVNPFILFLKAQTMERGDAPIQQYIKGLSEHWKKMPEDDKEEYVKTARANSARYRARLADWERQMIAGGHPELVRKSALGKTSVAAERSEPAAAKPKSEPAAKPKSAKGKSKSFEE